MIIIALIVLGLCLGSFVEALIWRLHEQEKAKGGKRGRLSIVKGRSMCAHCKHELSARDLIPLISWLELGGKCRYCKKTIGWHAPVLEMGLASMFVLSYIFWPGAELPLSSSQSLVNFLVWLAMLTGFLALFVYDLRWMLLPNRIIYPLLVIALVLSTYNILAGSADWYGLVMAVGIGGGIFLLLFQISGGKWIGGGDVKLGALAGLLLADGYLAFLMLFVASVLGTLFIVPGLVLGRLRPTSRVPFGPFLIVATVLVYLFGTAVVEWYKRFIGL